MARALELFPEADGQRNVDMRGAAETSRGDAVERFRRDTHNSARLAVDDQGFADGRRIARVDTLPEAVADDGSGRAGGSFVIGGERSADERRDPENGEVVARHDNASGDQRL